MGSNIFGILFSSAFITLVCIFPIFIIRSTVMAFKKKPGKAIETAKARGHVVTARLVDTHWTVPGNPRDVVDRYSLGIYEYEWDGRTYKYRLSAMTPPSELTLYFLRNPRKAMPELDLKSFSFPWFWISLGVFAFFAAIQAATLF